MASDESFVTFVCEQIRHAGSVQFRKMFGEYAIYCGDKMVALVCDNQLFVKPTAAGRALIPRPVQAPPYPQAKPWLLIADELDDPAALTLLIATTARELPTPKPKAVRKRG